MRRIAPSMLLVACAAEPPAPADTGPPGPVGPPYQELAAQGIDRYMGAFEAAEVEEIDGVVHHTFARSDGPQCLRGGQFRAMTRDLPASGDLVIFLQGGGLCYSELCIAITRAPPGIPDLDLLDPAGPTNPVAGWDQLYVPYCDGSLFAGDTDIDDDGDGEVDRHHRGLMNLSAALGVATASFPDTSRVVLAGSSGGGYGTLTAAVLTRFAFPDAEIAVINDAGVGLGLGDDPAFVWDVIDEFQAHGIVPASQASLLDGGHLTPLLGWQLSEDPRLRVSAISAREDYVISQMYLGVPGATFEGWLVDELGKVEQAAGGGAGPARFGSFVFPGATHTTLLGDPAGFVDEDSSYYDAVALILGSMDEVSIGGETVASWLDGFVSGDPGWGSRAE